MTIPLTLGPESDFELRVIVTQIDQKLALEVSLRVVVRFVQR